MGWYCMIKLVLCFIPFVLEVWSWMFLPNFVCLHLFLFCIMLLINVKIHVKTQLIYFNLFKWPISAEEEIALSPLTHSSGDLLDTLGCICFPF